MSKRIDSIIDILKTQKKKMTASQIADILKIRRNEASTDLNTLYKEGFVSKTNSRPVEFIWIESEKDKDVISSFNETDENDPFYKFEKQNPSLENAIEKAKAAVSYPPNGLNTILYGDTGVGKNYFAEKMWEYAKYIYKKNDISYAYFNCAEYADNPQLLLSQLFGHEKGAFTGANSEKEGLVKKANNGILILDEIHRLPPTGQELLFNLIDKGTIRKLGSTHEEKIQLMIIGATTENPNDTLLKTFTRRFPVVIAIPNLVERTLNEKLELIFSFFKQESKRLDMPIWIAGEALKRLVQFKTKNNIGELKNIISLCCAKSYINYLSRSNSSLTKQLHIELFDMPFEVYNSHDSLYSTESSNCTIFFKEGLYVYPNNSETTKFVKNKYYTNLYDFIEKRINHYRKQNISEVEIESKVAFDLDVYYNNIIFNISNNDSEDFLLKNGIIENKYSIFIRNLLDNASKTLGRVFSNSVSMAFALHVQQFVERTKNNKIIYNPNIDRLANTNYVEMEYLNKQRDKLSKDLGIEIPEDELGFWSLFLQQGDTEQTDNNRIEIIVLCHGKSTAASIASLANDLMAVDFVHAIDAPINKTFNEIYYEFLNLVRTINSSKGVLCLVDMGSLLVLEEKLQKDTYYKCKCIPNVTSLMVLDAVKAIMSMRNESLDDIYFSVYSKYVSFINNSFVNSFYNNVVENDFDSEKKTILTICTTGIGGAEAIHKYLVSSLDCSDIEIYNLSIFDDIQGIANKLGNRLVLIIGSVDPKIKDIPFMSVDKVFSKNGINFVKHIIENKSLERKTFMDLYKDNQDVYEEILNNSFKFAPSISNIDINNMAFEFCKQIDETIIKEEKENSFYVSLMLHFICLLERIYTGNSSNSNSFYDLLETNKREYFEVTRIVNNLLKNHNLNASASDIGEITRILL